MIYRGSIRGQILRRQSKKKMTAQEKLKKVELKNYKNNNSGTLSYQIVVLLKLI